MIWRILSRTGLRYCAAVTEMTIAVVFAIVVVAFYGEVIPTGNIHESGEIYFYVRSNGIHTELCLPSENSEVNWKEFIPTKDYKMGSNGDFVTLGWGDKGFFMNTPQWEDLTFGTAFSAIALPTPTAMHVKYEDEPLENSNCIKVYVSKEQYRNMARFIRKSFLVSENRAVVIPGKGYSEQDNFYEAHNSYHVFRTCNSWTNAALKSADVRTAALAVFPNGVMGHLKQ